MQKIYKALALGVLGIIAAIAGVLISEDPNLDTTIEISDNKKEEILDPQQVEAEIPQEKSLIVNQQNSVEQINEYAKYSTDESTKKADYSEQSTENTTNKVQNLVSNTNKAKSSKAKTKPTEAVLSQKKKAAINGFGQARKKSISESISDDELARREKHLQEELDEIIEDIDNEFINVDQTNEGLEKELKQLKNVESLLDEHNISPQEQKVIAEYLNSSYQDFNSEKKGYFRSIKESEENAKKFIKDMTNLNNQIISGAADNSQRVILEKILDSQLKSMMDFSGKYWGRK